MAISRIKSMLELCSSKETHFPHTDLYNEGWMLRLVLDWFENYKTVTYPLTISKKDKWYSEAQLPSAFLAQKKGDNLAEAWTHADGVIGHFKIGKKGATDLSLLPKARHLVVIEAKMFSKLSAGVKNAPYYNQAARNVACISETLKRAEIEPVHFKRLGFYVIAPQEQVDNGIFKNKMNPDSIRKIVKRRVDEYGGGKNSWYKNWFLPTMKYIDIRTISWEEVIKYIIKLTPSSGRRLNDFYYLCLKYGKKEF